MRASLPTVKEISCCLNSAEASIATLENFSLGETTLVTGTKAVADTKVTATSVVIFNRHVPGGTVGHLSYAVSAGVGVTFTSSSATDTSSLTYVIYY